MHQENETLPKVLKKVSNQLINAVDELNRLTRLQHLLVGALDIIRENPDQAEFMLELYEDHAHDHLVELTNHVEQARKLLGHPVSELDCEVPCSKRFSNSHQGSNGSVGGS